MSQSAPRGDIRRIIQRGRREQIVRKLRNAIKGSDPSSLLVSTMLDIGRQSSSNTRPAPSSARRTRL